jgi:hypothetical protein
MDIVISDGIPAPRLKLFRRLEDGPDYEPSWRFMEVERYLVEISQVYERDKDSKIQSLLAKEKDAYVRQLLLFQLNRPCEMAGSIEYAVRCHITNSQNLMGSRIKAMVVAGRTSEQIAKELSTSAANVTAFEKSFFDVRFYLNRRVWIQQLCRAADQYASAEKRCEARWMWIAYHHGWAGLAPVLCPTRLTAPLSGNAIWNRFKQVTLSRATDYLVTMDERGLHPSEQDVELCLMLQRSPRDGNLVLHLTELDFEEPVDQDKVDAQAETRDVLRRLSRTQRQELAVALLKHDKEIKERIATALQKNDKDRMDSSDSPAETKSTEPCPNS